METTIQMKSAMKRDVELIDNEISRFKLRKIYYRTGRITEEEFQKSIKHIKAVLNLL